MDEKDGVGVGPAERATHAGGDGPTPRRRMSARRKQDAVGDLREFEGRGKIQNARKAHRIALQDGIVSAGGGPLSIAGLLEVVASFAPGSKRGYLAAGRLCIVREDFGCPL